MAKRFLALLLVFSFAAAGSVAFAAPGQDKKNQSWRDGTRVDCHLSVDAGSDEEIDEDETVRLDGSVDGDYDNIDWDCTKGKLSNDGILRPTYDPPTNYDDNDREKTYTCTLTARNKCGSDSDSVKITVNYNKEPSNFRVVLRAKPKSACAPSNNVDLIATLEDYGKRDFDYIYKFDCDNDGDYEKTVTTQDTDYTATDLCDYRTADSYTARVQVKGRNKTVSDTVIVRATDCSDNALGDKKKSGRVSITKMVRNISRGTDYQGTVMASPSEVLSYKIIITAVSGDSDNVFIRDTMASGIMSTGGVQVDGIPYGGNLFSGVDIGDIKAGQTKTISYNAVVATKDNFGYGQTLLTNVATVTVGSSTASSNTTINVYRSSVAGATAVSTGVGGKAMPLIAAALAVFAWIIMLAVKGAPLKRFSRNVR